MPTMHMNSTIIYLTVFRNATITYALTVSYVHCLCTDTRVCTSPTPALAIVLGVYLIWLDARISLIFARQYVSLCPKPTSSDTVRRSSAVGGRRISKICILIKFIWRLLLAQMPNPLLMTAAFAVRTYCSEEIWIAWLSHSVEAAANVFDFFGVFCFRKQ